MKLEKAKGAFEKADTSMTLLRIWIYLTGLTEDQIGKEIRGLRDRFLDWPPLVFGLTTFVLKRSGSYLNIFEPQWPAEAQMSTMEDIQKWAEGWRAHLDHPGSPIPAKVKNKWLSLWECRRLPLSLWSSCPELVGLVLDLIALSDLASKGLGLPARDTGSVVALSKSWARLEPRKHGSSLAGRDPDADYRSSEPPPPPFIHPTSATVLPKLHTPKSGLTIRSFSHHLALCEPDEVQPRWFMIPGARGNVETTTHANLLVIPLPRELSPRNFERCDADGSRDQRQLIREGGQTRPEFTCEVPSKPHIADYVEDLCDRAQQRLGSLDGVIMPELALNPTDYELVRHRVLSKKLLFIAGVGHGAPKGWTGENFVCADVPLSNYHAVHFIQGKHHRWRLDGTQIRGYRLGGRLDPSDSYWENISLESRRLLFLILRPWLVTSVLICEDLARQEPVGELLGEVGPHLIIALLMDGPQLKERWSARYATVLADDPGCSVLSLSSIGMVELSRLAPNVPASRVVALWKDAEGDTVEIPLDKGCDAIGLSLSIVEKDQVTADGRIERKHAAYPVLTGVHQIEGRDHISRKPKTVTFLSPNEAVALARLVQQGVEQGPLILNELTGEAKAIAREIWRIKLHERNSNGKDAPAKRARDAEMAADVEMAAWVRNQEDYFGLPTKEQMETAKEIYRWAMTNSELRES